MLRLWTVIRVLQMLFHVVTLERSRKWTTLSLCLLVFVRRFTKSSEVANWLWAASVSSSKCATVRLDGMFNFVLFFLIHLNVLLVLLAVYFLLFVDRNWASSQNSRRGLWVRLRSNRGCSFMLWWLVKVLRNFPIVHNWCMSVLSSWIRSEPPCSLKNFNLLLVRFDVLRSEFYLTMLVKGMECTRIIFDLYKPVLRLITQLWLGRTRDSLW